MPNPLPPGPPRRLGVNPRTGGPPEHSSREALPPPPPRGRPAGPVSPPAAAGPRALRQGTVRDEPRGTSRYRRASPPPPVRPPGPPGPLPPLSPPPRSPSSDHNFSDIGCACTGTAALRLTERKATGQRGKRLYKRLATVREAVGEQEAAVTRPLQPPLGAVRADLTVRVGPLFKHRPVAGGMALNVWIRG